MCTSPILIRNKKFASLDVKTPNSFIKVPCGCCDECLRKRAKDLYIRVRFESENTILKGGCGFMCTLTYDDTNVPILRYDDKFYMVFNKTDVQLFLKRLRVRLDRFFMKFYGYSAPDFKYLVTSEYGTSPTATHRPHYHLIILFKSVVSLYIFRKAFQDSLINHKTGKSCFGRIFQCDPLDLKKGGIRYSAKYILKDQTYDNQNIIIRKLIKFNTDYVVQKHGIKVFPASQEDALFNKAIRSTKLYKKDVALHVTPYRHMLQFYMCSNDMGISAILDRYGEAIYRIGKLDVDGFAYSLPKALVNKVERSFGSEQKHRITKSVFLSQLDLVLDDSVNNNVIDLPLSKVLKDFAENYIQPLYGGLYFLNNGEFSYYSRLFTAPLVDYDVLLNEVDYYQSNDFFYLRDLLLRCMSYYNRQENMDFRAKVALRKSTLEHENYKKKKFNQGKFY